ncbi:hypothetical protein, partial [Escherichia albertii]|uniref:hypothetical protein n=1 Tax=Escherichia albertii TaxID=208962 RepID=UPI0021E9178A
TAILLNYRYLANMKSVRKAIHKNNSKAINCHYSSNSQRTFENQHHNLHCIGRTPVLINMRLSRQ